MFRSLLHRRPPASRPLARIALAALAIGASAAIAGVPAHADTSPPADPDLTLHAPAKQTVYLEGHRVYSDLGIRLIARNGPLRLDLQRPSYFDGIRVTERKPSGDVVLPSGSAASLNALDHFLRMDFTPVGTTRGEPFTRYGKACLGETTDRIDPDAAATSPYPSYCGANPYSLGTVQGVAEGYAASVLDTWGGRPLTAPRAGTYDVRVRITRAWTKALGIPEDQAIATTRVTIKAGDYLCRTKALRGCRTTSPRTGRTLRPTEARPAPQRAVAPGDLPADTPLPDLRALPAWGMQISRDGNYLQFSATVWNGGRSPLVVDGFRRDGEQLMDAYQYFFDGAGDQLPDYVPVGTFEWDNRKTHHHWHFRSFAAYSLLPTGVQPGGDAAGKGGVDSRKEAFCLAPTDAVDLTGDGAQWKVDNGDLQTACGDETALSVREVLQAGWGDTYAQFRAGQSFDLRGLPNGCYNVWVEGNPVMPDGARTLVESNTANNRSHRRVCIGGKPGARILRSVQKVGIIDESAYNEYY